MTVDPTDPFAGGDSNPSLSFKNQPIGTTYQGVVVEAPQMMQARNFDTQQPDFWPDGNPKQVVLTVLEINGERWSLWAKKPSGMFSAIQEAQKVAGAKVGVGATLTITFVREEPVPDKPHLNPKKIYQVVLQPADAFAGPAGVAQPSQPVAPPAQPVPVAAPQAVAQPVAQPAPVAAAPVTQPVTPPAQPAAPAAVPAASSPEAIEGMISAGMDPRLLLTTLVLTPEQEQRLTARQAELAVGQPA